MPAIAPTRPESGVSGGGTGHRSGISTVAAKTVMAVTGAVFAGFVLMHMVGNLKIYGGQPGFDAYAHWLRTAFMPLLPHEGLLWLLRAVLLLCLVAHLWCGAIVRLRGRRARGAVRARTSSMRAWAARSMPLTGLVLLGFLVFHLLDLTAGSAPAAADGFVAGSAYANVVASFSRPAAAAVYLVTMLVLAAHLAHGLFSVLVDLGVGLVGRGRAVATACCLAFALVGALGNVTLPISILTGVVK